LAIWGQNVAFKTKIYHNIDLNEKWLFLQKKIGENRQKSEKIGENRRKSE
jgi:hypothetical protein